MNAKQFRILLLLTVVSGFLGGAASNLLLRGHPAAAQTEGGKVADVVTAKKIVVVDEVGKERASLGLNAVDGASLVLKDGAGKLRACMDLGTDGSPTLTLADAAGVPRTFLGFDRDGAPSLMQHAADGTGTMLGVTRGVAGLWVSGTKLKTRALLAVSADGKPSLTLTDEAGNDRAVVGCAATKDKRTDAKIEYPESTVTLFKANGDVLWQAP